MIGAPSNSTMRPDADGPRLSVVVTSRNDGHGGNPLGRLQAFVNTFDAQCRRYGLDAELIVVEWNPPADRPRLREVMRRPAGCAFPLRYIEVPREFHERLPNAHVLPLFQMIGKNVGVRRARGGFVLCTNIDIIFSNALVEFFASGALRRGVIYRVDRHDIESDYPIDGSLDEQQAYCEQHQLRIHRSFGTFPVDARGRLVPLPTDVFDPPAVTIGDGWHVREGDGSLGYYRWATPRASLIVQAGPAASLALDVEPNPYDVSSWVDLEIADGPRVLTRARVTDRTSLRVALPESTGPREIVLRTAGASPAREGSFPPFERRPDLSYRLRSAALRRDLAGSTPLAPYDMSRWTPAHFQVAMEPRADGIAVSSARALQSYCLRYGPFVARGAGRHTFAVDVTCLEGNVSLHVVDEDADAWLPAEECETANGNRRQLFVSVDLAAGRVYSLYIANRFRGGDGISRFIVHSLGGSVLSRTLALSSGPRWAVSTARLFAKRATRALARRTRSLVSRRAPAARGTQPPIEQETHASATTDTAAPLTARIEAYSATHRPAVVHRNAAGDFQLMAREHWFAIHGYAEFTMYSMNIDGLLGDVACHAGVSEEILEMPRCIYHLEHEQGSGWTPEGEGLLRKRLSASGADWLDAATVDLWSAYMDWLHRPMLFNGPDWGFGDAVLPETIVCADTEHVKTTDIR